jgi:hypothetical protein
MRNSPQTEVEDQNEECKAKAKRKPQKSSDTNL